jgi:hypothetical protein
MIISLAEACLRYKKNNETFYTSACLIKQRSGHYPDWYHIDDIRGVMINVTNYERWADLERRAWLSATNDIYFILSYDFGLTDTKISQFMARHSNNFINPQSWSAFITKALFSLPQKTMLSKRVTMTLEFCYTGAYMIKILMDMEKNNAR